MGGSFVDSLFAGRPKASTVSLLTVSVHKNILSVFRSRVPRVRLRRPRCAGLPLASRSRTDPVQVLRFDGRPLQRPNPHPPRLLHSLLVVHPPAALPSDWTTSSARRRPLPRQPHRPTTQQTRPDHLEVPLDVVPTCSTTIQSPRPPHL